MTNHVPTLETCRRLATKGFPQATMYLWVSTQYVRSAKYFGEEGHHVLLHRELINDLEEYAVVCAAPILTELLEQLPVMDESNDHLEMAKGYIDGKVGYSIGFQVEDFIEHNPVEAAAQLWLSLHS